MKQESFFYNTTNVKNPELKERKRKAFHQEQKIIDHLKRNSGNWYTRDEINEMFFDGKFRDTSLSRALRNLTKEGYLIKSLAASYEGKYGVKVHAWTYNMEKKNGKTTA